MWRGIGVWRGIVWLNDRCVAGYGCVTGMDVWQDDMLWRGMGA